MNRSDIIKLRELREYYIQKYNENYRCCWPLPKQTPPPKYNPTFWNKMRLSPYKKYDLNSAVHYTIDEICAACNSYTTIPENVRKRDIVRIVYHNAYKKWRPSYGTHNVINVTLFYYEFLPRMKENIGYKPTMTFDEYSAALKNIKDDDLYPDVAGLEERRIDLYDCLITHIDYIIEQCKSNFSSPNVSPSC